MRGGIALRYLMKKFLLSAQGLAAAALLLALAAPLLWHALLFPSGDAGDQLSCQSCAGHHRHQRAHLGWQDEGAAPRKRPLTLTDFPAAADAPAVPFSTRPRRPVRMASLWTPSAAVLAQLSGGKGFRPQAPSTVTYGLRLHLSFPKDERELRELFLVGGDSGGADVMAISLESFVASLPQLLPARPEIFLVSAYSRGASELVASSKNAADIPSLKGKAIAVSSDNAGRYFLLWRLLREGVEGSEVQWVPHPSPAEAFSALKSGRAAAAFAGALDIGAAGETLLMEGEAAPSTAEGERQEAEAEECDPDDAPTEGEDTALPAEGAPVAELPTDQDAPTEPPDSLHTLASTADAPLLSPIVLVVRGDFAARYPETVRRLARAVLAEGALAAESPLPAARRLLERFPWLPDPRKVLALEPCASLADNKAFFGLTKLPAHPVPFDELFSSMVRVLEAAGTSGAPSISAEDVFWDGPLRSLSDKAVGLAKATSKTAQTAGARALPNEASESASAQEPAAAASEPAGLLVNPPSEAIPAAEPTAAKASGPEDPN